MFFSYLKEKGLVTFSHEGGLGVWPRRGVNNSKSYLDGRFVRVWEQMRCVGRKMSRMLGGRCLRAFQMDVSSNLELEMCGVSPRKDRGQENE